MASISGQIQNQNSKALPRFARPCGIVYCRFNLRANSRALARFARRRGFSSPKSPVKFRAKIRELVSLRWAMWFFLASIAHQIWSENSRALVCLWFILQGVKRTGNLKMHPGKPGFFLEISITAEKYKINFCSTPKQLLLLLLFLFNIQYSTELHVRHNRKDSCLLMRAFLGLVFTSQS